MKSEPRCPYCGREMLPKYEPPEDHFYRCLYCKGVQSPARSTPFEAWSAANKRLNQKPLTMPMIFQLIARNEYFVAYYEEIDTPGTCAALLKGETGIDESGFKFETDKLLWNKYGITWRVWAARPTEEELAAAPWEE